jgi:ankyrin repeat protein
MDAMRRTVRAMLAALFFTPLALAPVPAGAADSASLSAALQRGDAAALTQALTQGLDVNALLDGATPLHWAVLGGHADTVALLLKSGATPNVRTVFGVLPLEVAVQNGDATATALLLRAGANPNVVDRSGNTVLMAAARTGNVVVLKALLDAGADMDAQNKSDKQTALMWAAAADRVASVKALLEAGADVSVKTRRGNSALFFAVRSGGIDSVRALVVAGADVNQRIPPVPAPRCDECPPYPKGALYSDTGDSMLVVAILNGHFTLAEELVALGADVNAPGTNWAPLYALAMVRNYEQVNTPPPSITGDSLVLAQVLISRGAHVNARGTSLTPSRGGLDYNYNDIRGATAFLLAAKAGDLPLAKVLLAAGADPTVKTFEGTSALMFASGLGCVPGQWIEDEPSILTMVKFLVETHGADINATNQHSETALHGAVCRGANSVIRYLVDRGARLDIKDENGLTPLELAQNGVYRSVAIKGRKTQKLKPPAETGALLAELTARAAHPEH